MRVKPIALLVVALAGAGMVLRAQGTTSEVERLGPDIKPPRKIKDVPPVYPEGARVSDVVVLELTLDRFGNVTNATVLKSNPALDAAAIQAAKLWKFEPPMKAGVAVPVRMSQGLIFVAPPSVRLNLRGANGHISQFPLTLGGQSRPFDTHNFFDANDSRGQERYQLQPTLHAGSPTEVTVNVTGSHTATVDVKLGGGYVQAEDIPFSIELVEVVLDSALPKQP